MNSSSLSLIGSPKIESKPLSIEDVKDLKKTGSSITKTVIQASIGVAAGILVGTALRNTPAPHIDNALKVYKSFGGLLGTALVTKYIRATILCGTASIVAGFAYALIEDLAQNSFLPRSAIAMLVLKTAAAAA